MRVALVVMPFAAADSPSLAAGLLKAELNEQGIECDVKHFNVTLAGVIGADAYQRIATCFPSTALAGEWAFARHAAPGSSSWETYRDVVLRHPKTGVGRDDEDLVKRVADLAPLFLRLAADSNDWSTYDLVGFTSTFEQTMPAMALANEIRKLSPRTILIAGGANFEAGPGRALFSQFHSLDYACVGEGEAGLIRLCQALAEGRRETPPGFIGRDGSQNGNRAVPVQLDDLPIPDFHDYFRTIERTPALSSAVHPWIPLEASRGCWWGEKAHCTFCGLNGERMAFRHKSPGRIVEEVRTLARRHGHRWFQFADNILSMQLFDELYPAWSSDPSTPPKFFEVKSGLKREQVRKLRQAGIVSVQAGVESFSTATLKIMRKGISAAANVSFLRWCREVGVEAHWNLIWGFPGEPLEDYNQQLALAEKLTHLDPPESCCEIRMDRFSPNHNEWKALGFTAVRPATAYQHVFPFTSETIENLAIFFDADHPCADAARTAAAPLVAHCRLWQSAARRGEAGTFAVLPHISGGWILIDRRFNRPPASRALSPHDAAVLLACDEPKREEVLRKHIDMPSLDALRQMEAIIELDDRLVTIPLLPDQFRTEFREGESNA